MGRELFVLVGCGCYRIKRVPPEPTSGDADALLHVRTKPQERRGICVASEHQGDSKDLIIKAPRGPASVGQSSSGT